ncbi:DUF6774 domain-containing protein [Papillibacter cinnamivorans]|uniref:DUF6774 domain-containing protein n=1 Tax=Papillibacter cinnamivorans DSM 12816 TaxID=1122930 RepID=A0A1W2BLL1_9FIRM|nr:DUF6774 domain-containing protein [Papillibacter cinnamivorans]SMC73827.1 hypothetical protein SAMN02745168_2296 [Papillibacter cinnamivorans DSM 12816]
MTSCEWAATVTLIATAIAQGRTSDELVFLAALFTQLGDTLVTLSQTPPKGC